MLPAADWKISKWSPFVKGPARNNHRIEHYRYYKLWGNVLFSSLGPTNNLTTTGGTETTYPKDACGTALDNSIYSGLKSVVEGASIIRTCETVQV
jgi:hypothetical protein